MKKDKNFNKEDFAHSALLLEKKYSCPKCGIVDQFIDVTITGHGVEGKYCLVCLAKWYKKNISKLEQVK